MALDSSIILNLGRGVTPLKAPSDIQDEQMQREMNSLKLGQMRQGIQDEQATRDIARNTAPEGLADAYYKGGYVKQGQDAQKFQTEQAKSKRDALKSQVEQNLLMFEKSAQIMNGVNDQATWDRARQQTAQIFGPEAAQQMPAQYDPALIEQKRAQALTVKQQLEEKWKAMEFSTPSANARLQASTSTANNAATIANSRDNAQMTDARAREFNATKVEENRLKREAQGAGVKLTEDQGKATGWLVQAENAYKNMLAAGFDKDGNPLPAAKPGVADVIANSPLGGGVGNWLRSPDRQKFVQGASSLSESLLRAATGAGVNKDEAKQKIEELTPQWGEDGATTKQKMAAIPLYIESLKVRAGPGAPKAQEIGATVAPSGGVLKVTNADDYAKVPSGSTYTTPDGKTRRKP